MNREEFLAEVLASEFNNGNFEATYEEFKGYQNAALRTLKEFHRVCEDNRIPYQLAYGSLLGAIRDNGQIPWDYDIDVLVPYSEKERLIEALKTYMSKDFYFVCPEVDKKCIRYMIRIAPNEYDTDALHVDVFYAVGAPDDPEEQEKMSSEIKKVYRARQDKMRDIFNTAHLTPMLFLYRLKLKLKQLGYSIKKMDKDRESLCTKYDFNNAKYCIPFEGASAKIYDKDAMWNTEIIDTELGSFRVSKDYDTILTKIYKDYKRIFPLESRYNEMMGFIAEFRFFDKKSKKNKK